MSTFRVVAILTVVAVVCLIQASAEESKPGKDSGNTGVKRTTPVNGVTKRPGKAIMTNPKSCYYCGGLTNERCREECRRRYRSRYACRECDCLCYD